MKSFLIYEIYLDLRTEKVTIDNFKYILWTKKEFIPLVTVRQKARPT